MTEPQDYFELWRKVPDEPYLKPYKQAIIQQCADELHEQLEEEQELPYLRDWRINVPDILSQHTGEPKAKFQPGEEIPDPEDYELVGNPDLAENALDELNRIDVTELDEDGIKAYTHALRSVGGLVDKLEPEERRPNAKVSGFEVTDDD